MTSRYRVEYALKSHRRDQLIEWIKGLLAVPFVLRSQPTAAYEQRYDVEMAISARRRYLEILKDVEGLINDHIEHQKTGSQARSKLKMLIPSIGIFHTPLLLENAFIFEDDRRRISSRRFVAPSFNDIRQILNTAQLMSLVRLSPLQLITFDGDVTLYDDGQSLVPENPVIGRILKLLSQGIKVAIVTAAGYTEAMPYYGRLYGLLEAIKDAQGKGSISNPQLAVLGGESNFLFVFDPSEKALLRGIKPEEWMLDEMKSWSEENVKELLDTAEGALRECVELLGLSAQILRKSRAVGIIQSSAPGALKLTREQLEETVLVTQQVIEMSAPKIPFCAFNGGNDVFVDIGDKAWGVLACQKFFGGVTGSHTLHVGDQFLSAGANDFKARTACTTAWIASPSETVQLLDDLDFHARQAEAKS